MLTTLKDSFMEQEKSSHHPFIDSLVGSKSQFYVMSAETLFKLFCTVLLSHYLLNSGLMYRYYIVFLC